MRVIETVEEARQHIEANLQGLAKDAFERSQESRRRYDSETDDRLREVWKREAEAELRIAKMINEECDTLLKMVNTP
jgi:hypothetical protein